MLTHEEEQELREILSQHEENPNEAILWSAIEGKNWWDVQRILLGQEVTECPYCGGGGCNDCLMTGY